MNESKVIESASTSGSRLLAAEAQAARAVYDALYALPVASRHRVVVMILWHLNVGPVNAITPERAS